MQHYLYAFFWWQLVPTFYLLRLFFNSILNKCIADVYLNDDGKTLLFVNQRFVQFQVQIKDLQQLELEDQDKFSQLPLNIQTSIKSRRRLLKTSQIDRGQTQSDFIILPTKNEIKGYEDVLEAVILGKEIKVTKDDIQ
eukprot:403352156